MREWIAGLRGPAGQNRAVYAIHSSSKAVGIAQLYQIAPFQRRANLGIFIGPSAERGCGVGHVASCLLLDFAFNGLDLRRVELEVQASNTAAIQLYERLGFVREGVKRQDYFADGAYWDTYLYGLLKEEFALRLPSNARRLCLTSSALSQG